MLGDWYAMKPFASSKKTLRGHMYEPMYIVGERRICWARIFLSAIMIFFIHSLMLGSSTYAISSFALSIAGSISFTLISVLFLILIRVDRFAPWMAFLSAGTDLVLVTVLFVNSSLSDPLRSFTTASPYLYFVIIALAALRYSPTLVGIIGAGSAVVYLTIIGLIYLHFIPEGRAYVKSGDELMMGLNFIDEIAKAGLARSLWQSFGVLPAIRSVGVQGDERTYAYPLIVRAVTSEDAMTADWARLPYEVLASISSRVINEVPGINRVAYDISSKPPATIEWE